MLDWVQSLAGPGLLAAAVILGLCEGIVGVGLFIPLQPAVVIGPVAVDSVPEFLLIWALLTVGTIVGNLIGFEIGRRVGPALRDTKLVKREGTQRWDRVENMVHKHGTWAVFVGRLIPLLQGFVPPVAAAAGMPYRKFLPPMTIGAACSQAISLLLGIGFVASLNSGGVIAIIVVAVPVTVAVTLVVRKRRRKFKLTQSADSELEPAG